MKRLGVDVRPIGHRHVGLTARRSPLLLLADDFDEDASLDDFEDDEFLDEDFEDDIEDYDDEEEDFDYEDDDDFGYDVFDE